MDILNRSMEINADGDRVIVYRVAEVGDLPTGNPGEMAYVAGVKYYNYAGTWALATDPVDTTAGNAAAADILASKVAYVDGEAVTGTITSKTAATYTPGVADQTIAAGQYLSGAQTISGDADLVAANIKSGVTIFGVEGTYAGA